MVTTRNMTGNDKNAQEETSHPYPMTLILKIQKEMELLKKKSKEKIRGIKRRSEEEMEALRKENARMKQRLVEKLDIPEAVGDIPPGDNANTDVHEVGSSYQENIRPTSTNVLGTAPRRSPFVETILEVPFPGTWNNPTLDKYDGTTNPDEHVNAYLTQVGLHTAEDALWCRIFPASLKGAALSWFTRLPHRLF